MKQFIERIKELYHYRAMIWMLVQRDLRGKYKASFLGFLWTFINPLLQLVVYTMVFSVIMRAGIEKYYLFLFVALIPWIFFSTSVQGGSMCILQQKNLVTKIYFPRQVLPIAHVTTAFVNMLYCFVVVLAVVGLSIGWNLLALVYLIPIMMVEYLLALGMALLFSGITVYLQDMQYILNIIVMAWQFLTPIMYSIDQVPEQIQWVFYINPMTSIILAYRDILYYKTTPQLETLTLALVMGLVFLVFGWFAFEKMQRHFAEEL